jgi:hypothetical protein
MKYLLLLVLAMSATGCVEARIREDYEARAARMHKDMNALLIPAGAPTVESTFFTEPNYAAFAAAMCADMPKKADDLECRKIHSDSYKARISEHYSMSDSEAVYNKCKAYPVECKNTSVFEEWARQSHNDGVEAKRASILNNLNNGMFAEINEANRRDRAFANSMAETQQNLQMQQQQNRPRTCTGQNIGGYTSMTCY